MPDGVGAGDPLLVMLHGCSQHADRFRRETRMNAVADEEGFAGTTLETVDAEGLDPDRVYAAGLSAGAALVSNLLVEYADVYAAGGVHSGLEYDAAESASGGSYAMTYGGPDPQVQGTQAYDAMAYYGIADTTPTIVFHGTDDTTVYPVDGHQAAEQATQTADLAADHAADDGTDHAADVVTSGSAASYDYATYEYHDEAGDSVAEKWLVAGTGHAWSGGAGDGEYTAPGGPGASRLVWEFCSRFAL